MKRTLILCIWLFAVNVSAKAYRAAAIFIAEPGNNIQVIIDGKVINKRPKGKVSIVGWSGEHSVRIINFDRLGNVSNGNSNCIQLYSGYKSYYNISDSKDCGELTKIKMLPYTYKKFKNPDYYYSHKFITVVIVSNSIEFINLHNRSCVS